MRRWTVAVAALLVGTSAACSARTPPPSRWASPAELTWLQTYADWYDNMYSWRQTLDSTLETLRAAAGQNGTTAVAHAAQPLTRCRATIDRAIGNPPTPRLMAVLRLVRLGCANRQTAAREIDAAPH